MKKALLLTLLSALMFSFGFSQSADMYQSVSKESQSSIPKDKGVARLSFPKEFKLFKLSMDPLRQELFSIVGNSQKHSTVISLPNADGNDEQFEVYEASNFEPSLQAKYPEIRAFSGKGITDKGATLKLSISPQGVQTMVFRTEKPDEFMEPYSMDHTVYAVFKSQRAKGQLPWTCSTPDQQLAAGLNAKVAAAGFTSSSAGELKTMRLAQSCNAEYSIYFGATSAAQIALVYAAFNATLTRCNGCYEKDLALHLNLISNTFEDQIIFFNPATDPYTTLGAWNLQLQQLLTAVVGNANYDIGHMFGASGGGGNAGCIGCVCVDPPTSTSLAKGAGITSPADAIPQGDNFDIDYVVHEVGHQLGANHTFTHSTTEISSSTKEVGSGITIMGYAGITGQDVAPHSIDIYHEQSIFQIQANLATKTCPVTTNITANNATPVVAPVANATIPMQTPFALTGSATDANPGDVLTYCWEQNDANNASTTGNNSVAFPAKLVGPNFLSFSPTTSPTRLCPKLSTILAGLQVTPVLPGGDAIANIEALSNVARTLNFRLTVRDNHAYSSTAPVAVGQTAFTDMTVTVSAAAGPFQVTQPNTVVSWPTGSTQTVTWDVNNTTAAPVSCANVKISLSTDGGNTFPTVLVASTPNDGSETVTMPGTPSTTARIKVEAVGNIFFDISNTNFNITGAATAPNVTINQAAAQADPTSTLPINFTVVFDQAVTGFTGSGVTISGTAPVGTLTRVVTGGPSTYNVAVGGFTGSGTVIANVPAGVAQNASALTNNASTSTDNTVTYNFVAASCTTFVNQITAADPSTSLRSFRDAVTKTCAAPGTCTAGVAGTFQYKIHTWTNPVAAPQCVTVTFTNTSPPNQSFVSVYNGAPVLTNLCTNWISDAGGSPTTATPIVFSFTAPPSATISFLVTNITGGQTAGYSIDVNAPICVAAAGPTVTINQAAAQADPTSTLPINFTAVFSEPVTGFATGDVTISGTAPGTPVASVSGGPTTYTVSVNGLTGSGTVIASIAANVANGTINTGGNSASTSTDNTVTYNAPVGCTSVNPVPNQTVCNNSPTAPVTFTSPTPGTIFNWTNNTTSIGLAASGTGNIPSFIATNATAAPVTATVTVTPILNVITPTTTTFNFTGGAQTFTVPAGVTSINFTALGAQGGSGATGTNNGGTVAGGAGGRGSRATGTLAVTPGQVINIFVGGAGGAPTAGFNGGGTGGSINAGGGGGASDVRFPGAASADRILVAGGGAGGGRGGCEGIIGAPGAGGAGGNGDGNGTDGANSVTTLGFAGGGFGAIGVVPGLQGLGCATFLGSPGIAGSGPAGGNGGAGQACCCFNFSSTPGGGGGGGGFLGGAGGGGGSAGTVGCTGQDKGAGGGGAGGTSYTGGVTAGAVTTNIQTGNGQVVLNYNVASVCTGPSTSFTITVNPTATVNVVPNQTVCAGSPTAAVNFTSPTPGATFSWTNNTPAIGLAAAGTGNIPSFIAQNPGNTQLVATVTVTPNVPVNPGPCAASAPQTFTNNTPVAIIDNSVVSSTIVVAGAPTYLMDLNLQTFITHTFNGDLFITLTSPAGTVVTLTSGNGGGNDNVFNGTIWDDSANPGGQVPYTANNGLATDQTYVNLTTATPLAPEEALGAFIGQNPNGTWTLRISDQAGGDVGTLASWSMTTRGLAAAPTVANTSVTNSTPVAIVDLGVVSSTINVAGAGTQLLDVNLTTFITHTFASDLDITITSPSGTVVTLTTDNGGANDNVFNGTIWDDSANPGGQVPYTTNNGLASDHSYVNLTTATPLAPEEGLAAFIGENPNGVWTLRISDDLGGDVGSLASWTLNLQTSICSGFCAGTPRTFTITVNPNPSIVIIADPGTTICEGDPTLLTVVTGTATPLGVLYTQGTTPVNGSPSQVFEPANTAFNSQSADDFLVPAGATWNITQMTANGIGAGAPTSVNVFFYANSGSNLPGVAIATFNNVTTFTQAGGNYTVTLPSTVSLTGGRYWVSFQVNMSFAAGGQWFWGNFGAPVIGNEYAFQNPGGGFATPCTSWGYAGTGCNVGGGAANVNSIFSLTGTSIVGGGPLGAGYTFLWSPALGLSSTTSNPVAASPQNTTTYTVVATTGAGCTRTASVLITVNKRPVVTTQPVSTAVCAGLTATFTGGATGTGLTYQWQLSTAGCAGPWVNLNNATPYSGVNTPTLTVSPVTGLMNGYAYRLVVNGVCAPWIPPTNVSNCAVLTVNPLPVVTITPAGPVCGGVKGLFGTQLSTASVPPPVPGSVTVSSGAINLAVPDGNATGVNHTITVAGVPANATITNVLVSLNMPHTYPADMIFNLKGPSGQILNLYKHNTNTDNGAASIPTAGFYNAVVSGTATTPKFVNVPNPFRYGQTAPAGPYSPDALNGVTNPGYTIMDPTGFVSNATSYTNLFTTAASTNAGWTLAMADGGAGDVGTLSSWTITIEYTTPGTTNSTLSYVWSPLTGLYTDASAIVDYTGTNTPVVYAAPTTLTTYTVTATNTITGCVSTASVLVNYTPPAPTVTPNPVPPICLGDAAVRLTSSSSTSVSSTVTASSGPISVTIPDATGVAAVSTLNIAGVPTGPGAAISEVKVNMNVSHTWVGDVSVNIKAPTGPILNLVGRLDNGAGGNASDDFTNTTFSSLGVNAISGAAAPRTGIFAAEARPLGPIGYVQTVNTWNLLTPTSASANGTWTLALGDFVGTDFGTLTSWSISITSTVTTGVPSSPATWAPITGLFTDPSALPAFAYTGDARDTVWVKRTASGVYTYLVTVQSLPAFLPVPPAFTNPANITITNGGSTPYPSNLVVAGLPTTGVTVQSVSLNGINHTWSDDIDILLQSPAPGNQNVILMSDVGGASIIAAGTTYTFRDGSPAMGTGANPTGTYRPTNLVGTLGIEPDNWPAPGPGTVVQTNPTLSSFTGNMNGTWKLFVVDDFAGDDGSIPGGYTIRFNVPIAPCTSPARTVVVTVNQPTTITTQPVSQTICTDKVATFTVTPAGTGPFSYLWQVSTDNGNTWAPVNNGGVYSGANTATLTITAPPVSYNGYLYRVIVNGAAPCASITSFQVKLTVNPLPSVAIAPIYSALFPGMTTTLTSTVGPFAAAQNGYTWLRDGVALSANSQGVVSGIGTGTLKVDVDGMGLYTLRVTDINGCTGISNPAIVKDSASGRCFIYPNPSSGQFQVRYYSVAGNNNLPRGIVVYDAKGDRVFTQNYTVGRPYDRMDVDMRAFGKGLYWVEVVDRNGNRLTMCRAVIQ